MKKIILDDILLESAAATAPDSSAGCGSGCGCGVSTPGACGSASQNDAPKNFIALSSIGAAPKRMELADARAALEGKKGPEFWRSLNELAQSPQFEDAIAREWKSAPASWNGVSRRDFLKFAGASLALAGLTGCAKQPEERIFPYTKQPEDLVPGRPLFFASAASKTGLPGFGYAVGVLGESHMGRPTKLEGNPDHPSSLGSSDAITQATLYTLYDPDRSQNATKNGEASTWDAAKGELAGMANKWKSTRGAGLAILSEAITSPTLTAQMRELLRLYPAAKWHSWDAVNRDGMRGALGAADTVYRFDRAKVIVSLDSNFLADEPGSIRYARDYADGRRIRTRANKTAMNRLYAIESTPSITGANADHRWSVKSSEVANFAGALAGAVGVAGASGKSEKYIAAIADDLKVNRGTSLVIAGANQPATVHALAHQMNVALGNVGKTVLYVEPVEANPVVNLDSLKSLVSDMNAGRVNTLIVLGANPVYTAPADLKFLDAFKKVKTRVRLGLYNDETSDWCQWHLPARHYLEDWSDTRAHDGTASIVQPLIAPMYDGVSAHQLLSVLTGKGDRNSYNIVREYWSTASRVAVTFNRAAGAFDFETWWRKALNDGIIPNTAARPRGVTTVAGAPSTPAATGGGLEINFFPDPHIWDGAHSNNGWLQELPKPMTKMTWDNAALISLKTAREQNVDNYDIVKISVNGQTVEAPIWILPGQPDGQISVHLGYGRTRVGHMGNDAGFDAYRLRNSKNVWFSGGAQIAKVGRQARLAVTQENHMIDNRHRPSPPGLQHDEGDKTTMDSTHDRDLIRVVPIATFLKNPKAGGEGEHEAKGEEKRGAHSDGESTQDAEHGAEPHEDHSVGSQYEPNIMPRIWPSDRQGEDRNGVPEYDQDKKGYAGNPVPAWGMSIDLNTCIGCNACTVACQAENNIAIVGKDQVVRGREMHWIRVDRYYRGDVENPEMHHQPVPCMHCEKAPCEPVCPVEATTHSVEGINEMTYNRCVGTKYCSNNCPYKVRRFNFLQYSEQDDVGLSMMKNPDVTVRARGVMEKCNYCVQRVNEARVQAEKENRPIRDGEFTTACAQACPTRAIVFGDLQDKKSELYAVKAEPHNYGLLTELNTFPRTTYLAKLKNPNPALAKEV
jgi:MoCo/4Fe-4S cofactor protein with predicted Tat translocation signal